MCTIIKALLFDSEDSSFNVQYLCQNGTAQRQLDNHTRAADWILSGEDYIMSSIFEQAPVSFMPASGKSLGMCTCKRYTHFKWNF